MNDVVTPNRRVLLVDDNAAIFDDFRRILVPRQSASALDSAAVALFGDAVEQPAPQCEVFELDYASQGDEAVGKATAAISSGRPYAVAFVDMRMPPGWDGLTTIRALWEVDPEIQMVICTAYSDRSWSEIQAQLAARDQWLVLKKPFDKVEVLQMAQALTEKWRLIRLGRMQLATLEEHVRDRTAQLRRAMQAKHALLSNLTHELLTPMNGILGMLTLVRETPLTPDQSACLADAHACANRLNELLGQILAFNQSDAALTPKPQDFAPASLLEEVCTVHRDNAAAKGLLLTGSVDPALPALMHAPVGLIREALIVLVDNAVKFTVRGRVTVTATAVAGRVQFAVQDTGPGLTAEQVAQLATPFSQLDGRLNRRNGGIGIGLPLAHRLARSLGGELKLQSQPGAGTTVTFSAKAAPRSVDAKSTSAGQPA